MRSSATGVLAAMLVGAGIAACSAPAPQQPVGGSEGAPAPVSASGFYIDPNTPAAAQVTQWETEGRTEDAAEIGEIADQPVPLWVTGDADQVQAQTGEYVARAVAAGARPLLVAYNIPGRDCGQYSGGGAPDGDYYRRWVTGIAAAIGGSGATVVLEPDAVPQELSGCVDRAAERADLLGEAIDTLKGAGATVYLDAGHPDFITDVDALAGALERSGVGRADGFSLNVSNFRTTEENAEFGAAISQRLGGARFVIDTSRNGAGAPPEGVYAGAPSFCNPPDRVLGAAPTTDTGMPEVDALLWIKRPGESDGECRPGEPSAGQWFPDYALGLAERTPA